MRNVTIFAGFDDTQISAICKKCTYINTRVGDILLEENTPATEIFILIKGRVSIVLNLKEEPFELIEFGPGSCVGEASVIGIQEHSASAVVMEDASLLVLSRQCLMELFEADKGLFSLLILNIARELARRLNRTDDMLLKYCKLDKSTFPIIKN